MLDLKFVLANLEEVKESLRRRGQAFDFSGLQALDEKRRALQKEHDELRHRQNAVSDEIARAKREKRDAAARLEEMKTVAARLKAIGPESAALEDQLQQILLLIPNLPDAAVPLGKGEADNPELRRVGEPRKFPFSPRAHDALGEALGLLDFARAAKVSGARFAVLRGWGARLEWALIQFMREVHRERGYTEILPPYLVNAASLVGTGQLPKFEADLFRTGEGLYLVPTAEVPVTNLHRDEILDAAELPISYMACTPCFRSEAGSYGKDVKGLIRQHQFHKVELVKFTRPEDSEAALEQLTADAEEILRRLELPYRVVALCTADLGFAAARTYDLEVWLPSQQRYREISSCSNFRDYQARRANIRLRRGGNAKSKPEFVHTLNGSGLAVGRTFAAVLENGQQQDGSIAVPKALQPYLGTEKIN